MGIPSLAGPPEMPSWRKSSLSYSNGACVEVAGLPGGQVGVRNSRDPGGLVLRFTPDEWFAFLGGIRNGEFDRFTGGSAGTGQPAGTVGWEVMGGSAGTMGWDDAMGLHSAGGAG